MFDIGKELQKAFDEGYAYGIKEFAERLKNIYTYDKRYSKPIIPHTRLDFLFCKIDDLVIEMTEEEGADNA